MIEDDLNIVFVYLGNKIPKYLSANLKYTSTMCGKSNVWLVTDSLSAKKKFESKGNNVWFFENSKTEWDQLEGKLKFPKNFRNGFWFLTIKRFRALEAFMEKNPRSVLHVEGDVVLMSNFPFIQFREKIKDLAYPIVSPGYAIASTLFIKNLNGIKVLNKYIEKTVSQDGSKIDMTLLYDFLMLNPQLVETLPSGPSDGNNVEGYFDGAAFGTFLLGQDPRNFRGKTLKYSSIDWHKDKVKNYDYQFKEGILSILVSGREVPIYSLHNHSKEKRIFTEKGLERALEIFLKEYKDGPKKSLKVSVLVPQVVAALKRRTHRNWQDNV